MLGQQRLDPGAVAKQDEFAVGMPHERDGGPGHHDRRPVITPHGVKRNADLLGHGSTLGVVGGAGNCGPLRVTG
jgi:hypothetical protein